MRTTASSISPRVLYGVLASTAVMLLCALAALFYVLGRQSGFSAKPSEALAQSSPVEPAQDVTVRLGANRTNGSSEVKAQVALPIARVVESPAPIAASLASEGTHATAPATNPAPTSAPANDSAAQELVGKWRVEGGLLAEGYFEFYPDGTFYQNDVVGLSGTYTVTKRGKLTTEVRGPLGAATKVNYSYTRHGDDLILTADALGITTKCKRSK